MEHFGIANPPRVGLFTDKRMHSAGLRGDELRRYDWPAFAGGGSRPRSRMSWSSGRCATRCSLPGSGSALDAGAKIGEAGRFFIFSCKLIKQLINHAEIKLIHR